jgi:mercuric reductase
MNKVTFRVSGMTCDHCARTVEQALERVPSVKSAHVAYSEGTGDVLVEGALSFQALRTAVREKGYDLEPIRKGSKKEDANDQSAHDDSGTHVVIIGAGSGAFAAAIRASELGAWVTLIEKGTLGGTCVNVGCVPSKILIRQAHQVYKPFSPPFKGIRPFYPTFSNALLKEEREQTVLALRAEKYTRILQSLPNVTLIQGTAFFRDEKTIHVRQEDGRERDLSADRILIATGAYPSVPDIPGLAKTPFWTSTEALFSETVPSRLIVLGGGFVAVEIGQAYRRLGANVTIVQRNSQLLNRMDPDLGKGLKTYLEEEGTHFFLDAEPQEVSYADGLFRVTFEGLELEGDALLVATGRSPNTKDLRLDRAGVLTDADGAIVVDDFLQTSVPGIFAVGDCTTLPKFVYVAAASGTRAAVNMLGPDPVRLDLSVLPEVIFTDPQVASVGITESEALSQGLMVETRILFLDQVPRAIANFDTRGWVKMVAEKANGRLVGVQILAPEGGEIIQTAAMAIQGRRTVEEIGNQFFPYLTMVESLKLCAQSFRRDVKTLSCCAG